MDGVALADFWDKLTVGAVWVDYDLIIHLPDTNDFINNVLWISLTQFHLFGEQVCPAYIHGVRSWHYEKIQ